MSDSSSWNRALNLSERDVLFSAACVSELDPDLAARRLAHWRQESALLDNERFFLRLAQQGFDEARFRALLGCQAPSPSEPPEWLQELLEIYSQPTTSDNFPLDSSATPETTVFLPIIRPILEQGWKRLLAGLQALEVADQKYLEPRQFARSWSKPLPEQLLWMITRTLMLELTIRRAQGDLDGETPEERFAAFRDPLGQPNGAISFFEVYPVLARGLLVRLEQWVDTGLELATRLQEDATELAATLGGPLGTLQHIKTGLGDRHHAGRTVARLEFSSGICVIYKPRSLAFDVCFQKFLSWLSENGIEPGFRTLKILDREGYGWMEFVAAAPCRNRGEVERFYARQGAYLAILYALEATDFHHENLIAAGEFPVLVDYETFFQPVLENSSTSTVAPEGLNQVLSTVLRSGLLPRSSWEDVGFEGQDLSGLGGSPSNTTAMRELARVGTDEMIYVDKTWDAPGGDHRPFLDGELVPLWQQSDAIVASFKATYRRLIELREQFLKPGGWLDRFADLETRVIMRPTGLYARLLNASYHPDFLQDALHRERLFDKLWLDAEQFSYISAIIPFERRDLWLGDFPRFTSRTNSRHLWATDGSQLCDALPGSGLDLSRMRILSLTEEDLQRQVAVTRLSLAASRPLGEEVSDDGFAGTGAGEGQHCEHSIAASPTSEELLNAACRVGEYLEVLAFRDEDRISWFHMMIGDGNQQSVQSIDYDLYNGLGGIALFYAQLAVATDEERFRDLAQLAVATGRDRLQRSGSKNSRLGGYSGLGGWLYVLASLGKLWDSAELLDEAEDFAQQASSLIAEDEGFDLIIGSAGCIAGLLALYQIRPSAAVLETAKRCGDHLLAKAQIQEQGIGWVLSAIADRPLTGFAHGVAGIAWALARLAKITGEERFEAAARQGLAYERWLFSPKHKNWPDLRADRRGEEGWAYFHAWCHGAPGIGLSRLALLDVLDDDEFETEIFAAVHSTLREGFGNSHCLCHGDLGNLEFLAGVARRFEDHELARSVGGISRALLTSLSRDGYLSGITSDVDLPGLMTGLAGIGYGLLRLAHPEAVPSVLVLEPPGAKDDDVCEPELVGHQSSVGERQTSKL